MNSLVKKSVLLVLVLLVGALSVAGCGGGTQGKFPKGDITFLIPSGPGGGNDMTTRALIPGMKRQLNVNIVPANKPEAKGAVAATELASAKPDGQKIYFNSQTLLLMPYAGVPDVKLDKFQPVAQVVEDTASIVVRSDAPFKTFEEFVKYAKGTKMKVANNGNGALWHLSAIQLSQALKVEFNYIPYPSGGNQMLAALAAGEVELCVISPSESKAMIDSGRLKVLAVMSDKRHTVVPNVPTMKELGIDSSFPVWRGVFTTAGTSKETLDVLEKALKVAVESDEFKTYAKNNGFPILFRGHVEFSKFIATEKVKYAKMMTELNKK